MNNKLIRVCLKLMSDPESHVRQTILKKLPHALIFPMNEDNGKDFVKKLIRLTADNQAEVRETCSKHFIEILKKIGVHGSISTEDSIIELLKAFKDDENYQVRLNICQQIHKICAIGKNLSKAIMGYMKEWQKDTKWRVRLSILSNLGKIAKTMKQSDFDKDLFKSILVRSFQDSAYEIRREACVQLKFVCKIYGAQYLDSVNIIKIVDFDNNKNYLHRLVIFQAIEQLADCLKPKQFKELFSELVEKGMDDLVPNVRIACCHAGLACINLF
eukprot:UN34368